LAELVDALDSKSSFERSAGSTPAWGTTGEHQIDFDQAAKADAALPKPCYSSPMTYSLSDLELSRRRVAEDRKRIASLEASIDGTTLRGEASGLAQGQLIDLNDTLRSHIFELDLIAAMIKSNQTAGHPERDA
jgi:hypothetical protein